MDISSSGRATKKKAPLHSDKIELRFGAPLLFYYQGGVKKEECRAPNVVPTFQSGRSGGDARN
ncbi:MAG: hypothetical protein Q7S61_06345 [bacterium]|nr:hypothetical protein [bacterium]